MTRPRGLFCFIIPAFLLILGANRASAVAPEIKDDGKFFSADAVKKANAEIRAIARKYDKDVLIETYATVPGNQLDKVKAMSRDERDKFFQIWAQERTEAAVVRGVYIQVCKEPAHLEVDVTNQGGALLRNQTRQRLVDLLLRRFREKKYDEGLAEAIKLAGDQLKSPDSK